MTTINEAKRNTLLGYGYEGEIDEMYRNYLLTATGASKGTIQDLERIFFASLGYTGAIQDMWYSFLRQAGYGGAISDMWKKFWDTGAGFVQLKSDLTHSMIPEIGKNLTITATRSGSAETGLKHNPGGTGLLQFTSVADEAVFPGAMRLYNQWGIQSATLAVSASNSMTLTAGDYLFSMGAGTGTATFSGTGGATGTLAASASGRTQVLKTITAGTLVVTGSVATLVDLMVLNVTGETDQTTPRPYVSVGVLSAPYHGCNVDGVKCFNTDLDGNPIPASQMTRLTSWAAATQLISTTADIRDMTTASWTLGATMTRARTSVGWDGVANSATRLTGGAAAATNTITYTKTAAASSRTYSVGIKRITGTGPVRLTQDNFSTSTDISSQLVTGEWVLVQINQSQLNAVMGIKIDTDGDAIDADMNQFEAGAFATPRILTGGATRNAWVASYSGGDVANYKSIKCEFVRAVGVSSVGVAVALTDGTSNNLSDLYLNDATTNRFTGKVGGVVQWNPVPAGTYAPGTTGKSVVSTATNDIKFAFNGATQTADTSATLPVVTTLNLGHENGAYQLNGSMGGVVAWTRNLSQSELNAVAT